MKIKKNTILIVGIAFLLGNTCTEKQNTLPLEKKDQIKRIGSEAASALVKSLKMHLMEALAAENITEAFEFCAASARELTREVVEDLSDEIEIKRTTIRPRNPENAPDEYENDALAYFEAQIIKNGSPPENYIQYIKDKSEYRYYQPIVINDLCLKCHGEPANLDGDVRRSIKKNYPQDQAVGYKIEDFRGVIRVSIPSSIIESR